MQVFNLYRYSQLIMEPPYAVIYTGQAREWYGDDNFQVGQYKNKGQGGRILAINIPTMEMAIRIKDEMEKKLQLPTNRIGTNLDGIKGRSIFLVDFDGVSVHMMNELYRFFPTIENNDDIKQWVHPRLFTDYEGIEEAPITEGEIGSGEKDILDLLG